MAEVPLKSSRGRYRKFLEDYKARRLDDSADGDGTEPKPPDAEGEGEGERPPSGKRREYLKDYLHWLWPHRYATAAVFGLALVAAGIEMIEPLFMRYIIDRVLLNTTRVSRETVSSVVFNKTRSMM